jgi:hypothetical protein
MRARSMGFGALVISIFLCACGDLPSEPTQLRCALVAPAGPAVDPVFARAGKAGVCHRRWDGAFDLIDVSTNAVAAHLGHGDGLPDGAVPGDPSRKFDASCAIVVVASGCPCRFNLQALQDLNARFGDLGSSYEFVSTNVVTQLISRSDVAERRDNRFVILQAPGPDWPQFFGCVTRVYEPGFAILDDDVREVSPAQARACVEDLRALARSLGVRVP